MQDNVLNVVKNKKSLEKPGKLIINMTHQHPRQYRTK